MIHAIHDALMAALVYSTMIVALTIPLTGLLALLSFLAVPVRRPIPPTKEGGTVRLGGPSPEDRAPTIFRANPPMRVLRSVSDEKGMAVRRTPHSFFGDR